MLSVTFSEPIVIDPSKLHDLISLAGTPATVAPYLNGHAAPVEAAPAKATRQRRSAASSPATPAAGDKPKRKRATKAEMEARKAAAAGGEAPKSTEADAAGANDTAPEAKAPAKRSRSAKPKADAAAGNEEAAKKLVDRFAVLIDKDFDKASGLLAEFGAKRFGEVKEADYAAFDAKLKEAGV